MVSHYLLSWFQASQSEHGQTAEMRPSYGLSLLNKFSCSFLCVYCLNRSNNLDGCTRMQETKGLMITKSASRASQPKFCLWKF
ncbi:hypothetical protein AQUCO_08200023v1 [Aquilegia coerulea]|uniref:Uncharacterized protein n=1 Tax=Aquilegia coerulea TaxID=218851 RepID=A0A2G5C8T3_AQUCA|nr:hypothetical protein AQUCO_08200023v1 [Aquilegia coerulea]